MDLFRLSTATLAILLVVVLAGSRCDRRPCRPGDARPARHPPRDGRRRAGALLGLVGLLLAFGLSMAVGRYESRRALVVQEANDIGTTYLRAQMLAEPESSRSATLLKDYTDAAIEVADAVPGSGPYREAVANVERLQGDLWTLATDAVSSDPVGTGTAVHRDVEQHVRHPHVESGVARQPGADARDDPARARQCGCRRVLAFYLTLLGKGLATSLITAGVVLIILFVSFDLDRPQRGFIQVPDSALVQLRDSFDQP